MTRAVPWSAACAAAALLGWVVAASAEAGGSAGLPLAQRTIALADDRPIAGQPHADFRNGEVVVLDTRTGKRTNISRSTVEDARPTWSPDGRLIAWVRPRNVGDSAIWVMRPDGTGKRRLGGNPAEGVTWSPDGRQLAILDRSSGHLALAAVDVRTGAARVLTPLQHGSTDSAWSPDGARVAVLARGPDPGETSVLLAGVGGDVRRIALPRAGAFTYWAVAWSPDGRRLAVTWAANDAPRARVAIIDVTTEGMADLVVAPDDAGRRMEPEWSPDGSRIAIAIGDHLVVLDIATRARRELAYGTFVERPAWSPDGRTIAVRESLSRQVRLASVGGGERALNAADRGSAVVSDPSWDPAGRRLVYVTRSEQNDRELFLVTADGRRLRQLTRNTVEDAEPAWSADGRSVAFVRGAPDKAVFLLRPGRSARRLTRGDTDSSPTWSPDGRVIAFQRNDRIMAVQVANGRVRAITRGGDPAWSPEGGLLALTQGRELAVVRPTGSGRRVVYRAPASPNATTEVLDPVWHPSGRSLAVRVVVTHSGFVDERAVIVPRAGGRARAAACRGRIAWSPDTRWAACDFLGRIEVVSTRGGKPSEVTRGIQPRWRPPVGRAAP